MGHAWILTHWSKLFLLSLYTFHILNTSSKLFPSPFDIFLKSNQIVIVMFMMPDTHICFNPSPKSRKFKIRSHLQVITMFRNSLVHMSNLSPGWLGTRHQIQAFQGFSWNFLISQDLKSQVVHAFISGDNNVLLFHLWWREIGLKHEKVYKPFVQDSNSLGARDGFTQPIFYKRFDRFSL